MEFWCLQRDAYGNSGVGIVDADKRLRCAFGRYARNADDDAIGFAQLAGDLLDLHSRNLGQK